MRSGEDVELIHPKYWNGFDNYIKREIELYKQFGKLAARLGAYYISNGRSPSGKRPVNTITYNGRKALIQGQDCMLQLLEEQEGPLWARDGSQYTFVRMAISRTVLCEVPADTVGNPEDAIVTAETVARPTMRIRHGAQEPSPASIAALLVCDLTAMVLDQDRYKDLMEVLNDTVSPTGPAV